MVNDTIFALSSGLVPSGIAVVRISGPGVRFAFKTMIGFVPEARKAVLSPIKGYSDTVLDKGIVIYFPGPCSFTGEDCGELQIHGSRAVLNAVLTFLGNLQSFRFAEAGEFSKRAFENGRLDLTEVEGLSDLINANTEKQRALALSSASGYLRELYDGWRDELIKIRAYLEAGFDFSEEEDIPDDVADRVLSDIISLKERIFDHLQTYRSGEIIRDGFKVSLIGAPNSGKSSLLNALAKRDIAIVSDIAGTTRDVISVSLNLDGYEVVVSDTAGIHATENFIEQIGISRALSNLADADLILVLRPVDEVEFSLADTVDLDAYNHIAVHTKVDLIKNDELLDNEIYVSALSGDGLNVLESRISEAINNAAVLTDSLIIARLRHKLLLENTLAYLNSSLSLDLSNAELLAEELRSAGDQLGKIVGRVDIEDLLDVIFGEFCVGK